MPGLAGVRDRIGSVLHIEKPFIRNFLAEFLGTAILVIIGDGSVAQVVTSRGTKGDFFTINVAFAFAIAYGVYVSGSVSGGHINPAVTLVMAVLGKTAWVMLPIYWAGQYLGAFFGASIVHWVYRAAILDFGKGGLYVRRECDGWNFRNLPRVVRDQLGWFRGSDDRHRHFAAGRFGVDRRAQFDDSGPLHADYYRPRGRLDWHVFRLQRWFRFESGSLGAT